MIDLLVADLQRHIADLKARFLDPFLPPDPTHRPEDYEHDVKAACVLAHAALEEFVESVSMHVMSVSVEAWKTQRRTTDPLLALCLKHGVAIAIEDDEEAAQKSCFDLLREAVDMAKKRHSKSIQDNHGFSLKYLRAALTPVFINPPDDLRLTESLRTLTSARGSFAHSAAKNAEFSVGKKSGRARAALSPEDAWNAISDCVLLCEQIASAAHSLVTLPVARQPHVPLRHRLRAKSVKVRLSRLARQR
jgi:hypothetical protein